MFTGTHSRFTPQTGELVRKECVLLQDGESTPVTNSNRERYVMMVCQAHCLAGGEDCIL
jgi:hypothetical protein